MKGLIELGKCKILIRCKVRNLRKSSCGFYLKNVEFTLKNKGKVLLRTKYIR